MKFLYAFVKYIYFVKIKQSSVKILNLKTIEQHPYNGEDLAGHRLCLHAKNSLATSLNAFINHVYIWTESVHHRHYLKRSLVCVPTVQYATILYVAGLLALQRGLTTTLPKVFMVVHGLRSLKKIIEWVLNEYSPKYRPKDQCAGESAVS